MSLFIGRDDNSIPILHITSDTLNKEVLKSGVVASTIFHSSLEYVTAKVFTLTNIRRTNNEYFNITSGKLTNEAISYIASRFSSGNNPLVFVLMDDKIIIDINVIRYGVSFIWDYMDTGIPPLSYNYLGHNTKIPTTTHAYKWLNGAATSIKLIVLSLSYSTITKSIIPFVTPKYGGITLSADSINIEGSNLGGLNYVTFKDINALTKFSCNSSGDLLSVANTFNLNSKVNLSANSLGITLVNEQNEKLFDTNLGQTFSVTSFNIQYTRFPYSYSSSWYINNIVAENGKGIIISTFISNSPFYEYSEGVWTFCYVGSSTGTDLMALTVSASHTTYLYSIVTQYIGGILRYVIKYELIYMGSDGDPGDPPDPMFTILTLLS